MQSFLYEILTNTLRKSSASTMRNAKKQIFLDFLNKNEILKQKNDSTTPRLGKHNQTSPTPSTKVKEI